MIVPGEIHGMSIRPHNPIPEGMVHDYECPDASGDDVDHVYFSGMSFLDGLDIGVVVSNRSSVEFFLTMVLLGFYFP